MDEGVGMTRDLLIVNLVVGILLPVLVQLLTAAKAPEPVKSLVNLVVAAAAAVLTPLLTVEHVDWTNALLTFGQVFVLSISSHYGLMKPAGVTGSEGRLAKVVPIGIGGTGRKAA